MKRIIPILLLATIVFSQVGYYGVTIIRQHYAKEAMEQQILAGIPESNLTVFDAEANASKIVWEEKGKEFFLNGKLYDVAKTKIINGKTFLYCISDSKEDQVLKDHSNAVRSGAEQNSTNKSTTHLFKFYPGDWTTAIAKTTDLSVLSTQKNLYGSTVLIVSPYKEITKPPPKI